MLQFIETICFEHGAFQRIPLHQERMNRSRNHFFNSPDIISLKELLDIPELLRNLKVKCRITYSDCIENIEYETYTPKETGKLKCVYDDHINYAYKLKNRKAIELLLARRGEADDILIVKEGCVTDASYANVLFLKENRWYTPEHPLLQGTRRAHYLQNGMISAIQIKPADLWQFEEVRLINAMLSIEDAVSIPINRIIL